jgi:lysophospholipase L1-like esterase
MKKLLLFLFIATLGISFAPKKLTWTAIGDSITYLNDHPNETGNRITKGYLTRVTEKLPDITFTNQGHNGWTAVRIAENIEKLGITKADVYSVFLGTNDWWHGGRLGTLSDYQNNTGTATTFGAFRVIIDKLRSLNKDARIILITPMQRADFVYINNPKNNAWGSYKEKEGQTLAQFAEAVSAIGKLEKLPVIDLYHEKKLSVEKLVRFKRLKDPKTNAYRDYPYPQFTGIPFNPETDDYPYPAEAINMTYDGLHPSDKGYEVIAKLLVKEMKKF